MTVSKAKGKNDFVFEKEFPAPPLRRGPVRTIKVRPDPVGEVVGKSGHFAAADFGRKLGVHHYSSPVIVVIRCPQFADLDAPSGVGGGKPAKRKTFKDLPAALRVDLLPKPAKGSKTTSPKSPQTKPSAPSVPELVAVQKVYNYKSGQSGWVVRTQDGDQKFYAFEPSIRREGKFAYVQTDHGEEKYIWKGKA